MEPSQTRSKLNFQFYFEIPLGNRRVLENERVLSPAHISHFQGVKENRANSRENYSGMKWMICFLAKSSAENILIFMNSEVQVVNSRYSSVCHN